MHEQGKNFNRKFKKKYFLRPYAPLPKGYEKEDKRGTKDELSVTKYRFHWQDEKGTLIKRWDNASHHPEIDTFPDHLHEGAEENVLPYVKISGIEVLSTVIDVVSKNRK